MQPEYFKNDKVTVKPLKSLRYKQENKTVYHHAYKATMKNFLDTWVTIACEHPTDKGWYQIIEDEQQHWWHHSLFVGRFSTDQKHCIVSAAIAKTLATADYVLDHFAEAIYCTPDFLVRASTLGKECSIMGKMVTTYPHYKVISKKGFVKPQHKIKIRKV